MPWTASGSGDKKKHPAAHLSWIVNDNLSAVLDCAADVDERLLFRRQRWGHARHLPELWQFLRGLGRQRYDLVLDLQGLFRSGLCTWFADAPHKVGFADAREGAGLFYTEKVAPPPEVHHAIDRNLALAAAALGSPCPYEPPRIAFPAETRQLGEELRQQHGLDTAQAVLAVGPCSRWESKTWPPAFFAETIDRISDGLPFPPAVWLLGTDQERPVGDQIAAETRHSVVNLMGRTSLPVMMYLLARSHLLISNDSGPMHLAAALSVPTVSLFGPTDPTKTGPYGTNHRIFQSEVECAPCFQRQCPLPEQICRTDVISPQRISTYSIACLEEPQPPVMETTS